ncbi:hypothetical protein LP419_09380 [Massilia sp. H-1]|nr:hypothetical protein LP419_09380 [Massilia sp. H-1]
MLAVLGQASMRDCRVRRRHRRGAHNLDHFAVAQAATLSLDRIEAIEDVTHDGRHQGNFRIVFGPHPHAHLELDRTASRRCGNGAWLDRQFINMRTMQATAAAGGQSEKNGAQQQRRSEILVDEHYRGPLTAAGA